MEARKRGSPRDTYNDVESSNGVSATTAMTMTTTTTPYEAISPDGLVKAAAVAGAAGGNSSTSTSTSSTSETTKKTVAAGAPITMREDSHTRSLAKGLTWRFVASGTTIVIAKIVTGETTVAFQIGFFEFFAKILIYYAHERIWARIRL